MIVDVLIFLLCCNSSFAFRASTGVDMACRMCTCVRNRRPSIEKRTSVCGKREYKYRVSLLYNRNHACNAFTVSRTNDRYVTMQI